MPSKRVREALRCAPLVAPVLALALGCAADQSPVEAPMQPAAGAVRSDASPFVAAPAVTEPAALATRHTAPHGTHLVDQFGRSLYGFSADSRGVPSTCHDVCARAWPPVLSEGTPRALSDDVESSKFGTLERPDGATQATYDGWPLYHYARDRLPGEALGQGVSDFGGTWYLLAPNGSFIDDDGQAVPPAKPDPTSAPPPLSDVPVPPDHRRDD